MHIVFVKFSRAKAVQERTLQVLVGEGGLQNKKDQAGTATFASLKAKAVFPNTQAF